MTIKLVLCAIRGLKEYDFFSRFGFTERKGGFSLGFMVLFFFFFRWAFFFLTVLEGGKESGLALGEVTFTRQIGLTTKGVI